MTRIAEAGSPLEKSDPGKCKKGEINYGKRCDHHVQRGRRADAAGGDLSGPDGYAETERRGRGAAKPDRRF